MANPPFRGHEVRALYERLGLQAGALVSGQASLRKAAGSDAAYYRGQLAARRDGAGHLRRQRVDGNRLPEIGT